MIKSLVEFAEAQEAGKLFEIRNLSDDVWEQADLVAGGEKLRKVIALIDKGALRVKLSIKKIDLSCLAGSGVLCEFGDGGFGYRCAVGIGLLDVTEDHTEHKYFNATEICDYSDCRPLFNYWHHHDGGECPIPEGFVVTLLHRDNTQSQDEMVVGDGDYWEHKRLSGGWRGEDIIAYRITGIAEGFEL